MTQLRQTVSGVGVFLYGLGTILGAGIYVLVGAVAERAGDRTPLAFLLAALLALLSGFSFAELSARYPQSAGEAKYVSAAFNNRFLTRLVGILVAITGVVSAATLAVGFQGYLEVFVLLPRSLSITAVVVGMGLVASWGINASIRAAATITLVEVGGLLFVLAAVAPRTELGSLSPDMFWSSDPGQWSGIGAGAFLAFYAFIGFEDIVNVAEEVKRPRKNLPRAIFLSLTTASLLYVAVAIACLSTLGVDRLAQSGAPLATVYQTVTGKPPTLIAVISLLAVVNGALVQIVMGSRVFYGLSELKALPAWFGKLNPRTQTPINATVLVTLAVLVLALLFPVATLAQITSFIMLTSFALVNLACVRIRIREQAKTLRWLPTFVPALACISSLALIMFRVWLWFELQS